MSGPPNYYEVLGIQPSAKLTDVTRAYNRWVADFKKETTPPDPRRESLLREAYEILSNDERRDAYDAELKAHRAASGKKKGAVPVVAAAGAAVVLMAVGGFLVFRPSGPPPVKARSAEEIQLAMAGSVSPIITYDISGKSSPAGLAFVIEDKLMVANCQALPPGVQLMVNTGGRQVAARVTLADESLGLCKLITDGYVGEPLRVNTTLPAVGSRIFTATLGPKGEVGVKEAKVIKVLDEPSGKALQASVPDQAGGYGAPLLDEQGRVVAVATLKADGSQLHRLVPAAWLAENRPKADEPKPYQGGGPAPAATAGATTEPGEAMLRGEKPANWEELGPDEREQWERGQAEIQRRRGAIAKGLAGKK